MIITTTPKIEGCEIKKIWSVVTVSCTTYGSSFIDLITSKKLETSTYETSLNFLKDSTLKKMKIELEKLGANAAIGAVYNFEMIKSNSSDIHYLSFVLTATPVIISEKYEKEKIIISKTLEYIKEGKSEVESKLLAEYEYYETNSSLNYFGDNNFDNLEIDSISENVEITPSEIPSILGF